MLLVSLLSFQGKTKPSFIKKTTDQSLRRVLNYHILMTSSAIVNIILLIYFTITQFFFNILVNLDFKILELSRNVNT